MTSTSKHRNGSLCVCVFFLLMFRVIPALLHSPSPALPQGGCQIMVTKNSAQPINQPVLTRMKGEKIEERARKPCRTLTKTTIGTVRSQEAPITHLSRAQPFTSGEKEALALIESKLFPLNSTAFPLSSSCRAFAPNAPYPRPLPLSLSFDPMRTIPIRS